MRVLDEKDKGLLSLLRSDARSSVADLAKRLGVSRATILNRMRRLETDGVVLGYTVRLSSELDRAPVSALMSIRVESDQEPAIVKGLRGNPAVSRVHHTTGRWDLIAEIDTDSLSSINHIVGDIRQLDGVIATETNLLLETFD